MSGPLDLDQGARPLPPSMTAHQQEGSVQMAPHETIWVRGDEGICNVALVRSFAIHELKAGNGWMVWAHAAMRDSKAIPLMRCASEEEAQAALNQISGLVGALDIRREVDA